MTFSPVTFTFVSCVFKLISAINLLHFVQRPSEGNLLGIQLGMQLKANFYESISGSGQSWIRVQSRVQVIELYLSITYSGVRMGFDKLGEGCTQSAEEI